MPQVPRSKIGFLRLVALARPEFNRLFWGTLMLVASSAMGLLYPQAVRVFVDDAVKSGDHTQLNRAAGAMFIIFLVQSLTAAARYFWFTIAGERIVMHLRNRLYETILHQEMDFFDRNRTGDLLSRLASDATILQNAASVNISMLVRSLAMVAGGTALLFWTSPKLTALMLASVPPVALGAAWFGGRVKRLSRVAQDKQGLASTVAEETISGIRTVRSFAAESREELRYGDAADAVFSDGPQENPSDQHLYGIGISSWTDISDGSHLVRRNARDERPAHPWQSHGIHLVYDFNGDFFRHAGIPVDRLHVGPWRRPEDLRRS